MSLAIAGCMALLAVATAGVASVFFPFDRRSIDVKAGREVFVDRCSTCHTVNSNAQPGYGPSLHDIAAKAETRIPGVSREAYIYQSIVDPAAFRVPQSEGEMPQDIASRLSDAQLRNVAAYLAEPGGSLNYRALLHMTRPPTAKFKNAQDRLDLDRAEMGRSLFFGKGKCSSCHSFVETPGADLVAPCLKQAGVHTRDYLRTALLEPSKNISSQYKTWQVVTQDGLVQQGHLLSDGKEIRLLTSDASGRLAISRFSRDSLEPFDDGKLLRPSDVSEMPAFGSLLNDDEIDAIVTYLSTFR